MLEHGFWFVLLLFKWFRLGIQDKEMLTTTCNNENFDFQDARLPVKTTDLQDS